MIDYVTACVAIRRTFLVFAASPSCGQSVRAVVLDEGLQQSGLRVERAAIPARGLRELRILLAGGAPSATTVGASQVISTTDRDDDAAPWQRSPKIGDDDLVVVLNSQQIVCYSRIATDPWLARGEFPDANGNLQKTTGYRQNVELLVPVPAGIDLAELRILTPGRACGTYSGKSSESASDIP